jgi:hypothetical protein
MSTNLPTFAVQQFSTNINLLLQQNGSKLSPYVMHGSHHGDGASPVDQIGAVDAQVVTSKFGPMGRVDAPLDRRWVYPISYDLPQLVDSIDQLKLITDPKSALVQNAVMAMNRAKDKAIIAAYLAAAKTGVANEHRIYLG